MRGLPAIIGQEGAGVVTALGPDVTEVQVGDRVAYAGPLGAYAATRVIQADRLIRLPDTIGFPEAASVMLQGLTAQYLLRRTYPVKPGQTILVHAAAGGVGLILAGMSSASSRRRPRPSSPGKTGPPTSSSAPRHWWPM